MDKDTHGINTARLANVWMDDYKRLYYLHREEYKVRTIFMSPDKPFVPIKNAYFLAIG